MRPGPRDVLTLLGRGPALVETALGLVPRAVALLEAAEDLVARVDSLIDRIETSRLAADDVIRRVDQTNTRADHLVVRGAGLVGSVEPTIERGQRMFDSVAPALERLQPVIDRISKTIDPGEVEAVVRLVDHLPDLVERIETDILPMMDTLRTVGPDVHDLLDLTRELNTMLGKLPGMGRVRKRVEEQQERNEVAGDEDR